jgi:hypothetical protein
METFVSIPGYEGLYEASDQGRLQSCHRLVHSYIIRGGKRYDYNKVVPPRILKQTINHQTGYLQVSLSKNGKSCKYRVHTLVAMAWCPQVGDRTHVNHKNCVKTDNRAFNLEWCTKSENQRHAYINDRLTLNGRGPKKHKTELENSLK